MYFQGDKRFVWTPLQIPKVNLKMEEPGVVEATPITIIPESALVTPSIQKTPEVNSRRKPANPRKSIKIAPAPLKVNGTSPTHGSKPGTPGDFSTITVFQCAYCDNTFTSKTGLQNHIFSQHKDHAHKQFACDKCPKRFMTYGSLHRHKNAHNGIFAHKCPICQKGFANGKDLEGHMYKHTGVKPFQCSACEMTFAYKCNLMSHLKTMHKE